MAARPFMDAPVSINNKTATGILQYKGIPNTVQPVLPQLLALNNTAFALSFNAKLRSLNTAQFPASVPLKVDRHLFYTIGLGINQCTTCLNGTQLIASLNNITFVMPQGSIYHRFPRLPSNTFQLHGCTTQCQTWH
ncbi:laccase-11 [Prunus yedoensis var. nudiflora]|uniref:Laccase-11 n=1 Tax=Prunus yedoensis var. nudiflora TaxID=2094558 RepID=A0A314YF48_PRUYE|nr:laccase-11 [Prunus yedoensis var. nudiflora]